MTKLSESQTKILTAASKQSHVDVREQMKHIKSPTVKEKVIKALLKSDLIIERDSRYLISDAGFEALGFGSRPAKEEKSKAGVKAKPEKAKSEKPLKVSKKQIILDLASAKDGVTLTKLMKETSWQQHSVRGQIANMRKALLKEGRDITSSKSEAGERTYKLIELKKKAA